MSSSGHERRAGGEVGGQVGLCEEALHCGMGHYGGLEGHEWVDVDECAVPGDHHHHQGTPQPQAIFRTRGRRGGLGAFLLMSHHTNTLCKCRVSAITAFPMTPLHDSPPPFTQSSALSPYSPHPKGLDTLLKWKWNEVVAMGV